ncbi:MAG TPA: alpha/beta fold hydrolase [Gryllotalpicola sp.]
MTTSTEPTSPRWNRTRIRDTTLAWTEFGSGPVTVWAHPLASSGLGPETVGPFDWEPVAAAGHRLIRYDARGHGRSGGAQDPADFSFENLGRDLLALIDVLSPAAPVSGIGMSLGTATLLHAAAVAPDRFDRLVLTAPPTAWETRAPQGRAYDSMAELVEDRGLAALEPLMREAPVPVPHRGAKGMPLSLEADARLLPSILRGVGASDLPPREVVGGLRLPVLILPWADDPTHPVSTAEELARLIPGSRMETAESPDDLSSWGARAAEFLAG